MRVCVCHFFCVPLQSIMRTMQNNTLHYLWLNYKSEAVFGLVLMAVLIPSTFLSRLIPEDFFDNFLNPALSFAFALICFFGAILCLRHLENNRIRKVWAIILILWGIWELVMVAMFKSAYNPFQVGNELMGSTSMLLACVFAWMLLIYPSVSIRPGKYNWRHGAMYLLPLVVLGLIDYVLPFDLRVLIAFYPIGMMVVIFLNIRRYRQWCEENFSTLDDIDAQWIARYMVMVVLSGLVFYYLCVSDDPARAFTQQWDRLRSTAVEEEKEETNPANAAYRAALEAWLEKEKPYLNPDFQLADLREVLPMNRTYLSQFINAEYGCSFYHWVNSLRIAEAKRLMTEHPEIRLKEIAQQSGFSSPTVFSRVFMRETGISPREWK